MTPQLLTTTQAVDQVFLLIFAICAVMLLGITVTMVVFVIRYRRARCPRPLSQTDHNLALEIVWTVIPTALVLAMFWYGWEGYLSLQRIPKDAYEIHATARMWSWTFAYPDGERAERLYVPVDRPVKVRLESADVLHSFYVPAFRVKRDTVPGMTTWVWFTATRPGSYDLFCAEYCGVGHAAMITTVEALPEEEFAAWLLAKRSAPVADGEALLKTNGCLGCHSLDGSRGLGPTLKGVAGRLDAAAFRRAVHEPLAELVEGYPPIMPAYPQLGDEELEAMRRFLDQRP